MSRTRKIALVLLALLVTVAALVGGVAAATPGGPAVSAQDVGVCLASAPGDHPDAETLACTQDRPAYEAWAAWNVQVHAAYCTESGTADADVYYTCTKGFSTFSMIERNGTIVAVV